MKRQLKIETIERGLKDSDCDVRAAAIKACTGRTDIPVETIERGLKDSDWRVRAAAMNACTGRTDIPVETIERWLKDSDHYVRLAAMNACLGRTDIPVDTIERGLQDSNWRVRAAAMKICKKMGRPVPAYRDFEPPERVYKKCLGGVIVVAEIPQDANVRGRRCGKGRADKAKIIDIIGTFAGEQVGVSLYDKQTTYFVGDEVVIENFDLSNEECSTGFHFFCTLDQAKKY